MPESPSSTFPGIFICYRRNDTGGHAGWLTNMLVAHFGENRVFKDTDTIELGEDFANKIKDAVASCDVLVALIGRNWLSGLGATGRLNDPKDYVRVEIAEALKRKILVIPVLVQKATMPKEQDLPQNIADLAQRHALEFNETSWKTDVDRLIAVMERALTERQKVREEDAAKKRQLEQEEQRDKARADEERQRERLREQKQEEQRKNREAEEATRLRRAETEKAEAEKRARAEADAKSRAGEQAKAKPPVGSPSLSTSGTMFTHSGTEGETRNRTKLFFIGVAVIAATSAIIWAVSQRPGNEQLSATTASKANIQPSPSPTQIPPAVSPQTSIPSATAKPIPTPDEEAFQEAQQTVIANQMKHAAGKVYEVEKMRKVLRGDLNKDGANDAALFFCYLSNPKEELTVASCYVAAFINVKGTLTHVSTYSDALFLNSLRSIKDGVIFCGVHGFMGNDQNCCPTIKGVRKLALIGGELEKVR